MKIKNLICIFLFTTVLRTTVPAFASDIYQYELESIRAAELSYLEQMRFKAMAIGQIEAQWELIAHEVQALNVVLHSPMLQKEKLPYEIKTDLQELVFNIAREEAKFTSLYNQFKVARASVYALLESAERSLQSGEFSQDSLMWKQHRQKRAVLEEILKQADSKLQSIVQQSKQSVNSLDVAAENYVFRDYINSRKSASSQAQFVKWTGQFQSAFDRLEESAKRHASFADMQKAEEMLEGYRWLRGAYASFAQLLVDDEWKKRHYETFRAHQEKTELEIETFLENQREFLKKLKLPLSKPQAYDNPALWLTGITSAPEKKSDKSSEKNRTEKSSSSKDPIKELQDHVLRSEKSEKISCESKTIEIGGKSYSVESPTHDPSSKQVFIGKETTRTDAHGRVIERTLEGAWSVKSEAPIRDFKVHVHEVIERLTWVRCRETVSAQEPKESNLSRQISDTRDVVDHAMQSSERPEIKSELERLRSELNLFESLQKTAESHLSHRLDGFFGAQSQSINAWNQWNQAIQSINLQETMEGFDAAAYKKQQAELEQTLKSFGSITLGVLGGPAYDAVTFSVALVCDQDLFGMPASTADKWMLGASVALSVFPGGSALSTVVRSVREAVASSELSLRAASGFLKLGKLSSETASFYLNHSKKMGDVGETLGTILRGAKPVAEGKPAIRLLDAEVEWKRIAENLNYSESPFDLGAKVIGVAKAPQGTIGYRLWGTGTSQAGRFVMLEDPRVLTLEVLRNRYGLGNWNTLESLSVVDLSGQSLMVSIVAPIEDKAGQGVQVFLDMTREKLNELPWKEVGQWQKK